MWTGPAYLLCLVVSNLCTHGRQDTGIGGPWVWMLISLLNLSPLLIASQEGDHPSRGRVAFPKCPANTPQSEAREAAGTAPRLSRSQKLPGTSHGNVRSVEGGVSEDLGCFQASLSLWEALLFPHVSSRGFS